MVVVRNDIYLHYFQGLLFFARNYQMIEQGDTMTGQLAKGRHLLEKAIKYIGMHRGDIIRSELKS